MLNIAIVTIHRWPKGLGHVMNQVSELRPLLAIHIAT